VQKLYWLPRLNRDKEVEETAEITLEAPHYYSAKGKAEKLSRDKK
jgi:hypothetical protein